MIKTTMLALALLAGAVGTFGTFDQAYAQAAGGGSGNGGGSGAGAAGTGGGGGGGNGGGAPGQGGSGYDDPGRVIPPGTAANCVGTHCRPPQRPPQRLRVARPDDRCGAWFETVQGWVLVNRCQVTY